jgi:hypothetical protein
MKSIQKITKCLLVLLLITGMLSCENYLDVNKDPRYPEDATTPLLFSSGIAWTSSRLGRDAQLVGSIWSQHYTQNNSSNQYKTIDSYNLTNNSGEITSIWSSLYTGALADLKIAISKAETNGEWNYWLASKVMMAFDYYILASFFEKIPFSEALTSNYTPKYDEGSAVLSGIIALLDEAIAKKAEASGLKSMENSDLVFDGNINNWVKFAKTLKLKILMRDFSANQAAIQTLLTEGDFLTVDAKLDHFVASENYSNPLYEADRRKLNTALNIRVSATLATFLNTYSDPRIAAIAEPVTTNIDGTPAAPNTYRGVDQGTADHYTQAMFPTSAHSRARIEATDAVFFLSAADSYFLQAEAYARLNNPASAKAAYDLGVTASFKHWGYEVQAASFIAAGGAYEFQTANLDAMLESILTQKWVASARCQAWDTFFDICRTGIPALGTETVNNTTTPSVANPAYVVGNLAPSYYSVLPEGEFPRRYLFPLTSTRDNPNAPSADDYPITKKMWWHK